MRTLSRQFLVATLVALAACGGQNQEGTPGQIEPDGTRPRGQTSFETPSNGNVAGRAGDYASDAENTAPSAGAEEKGGAAQPRLIEESDIYKIVDNHLYILNRYRGLQILDISNLDAPRLVGSAPMYGYPKDMYVRNGFAYVIVSDYWSYWRDEAADSVGAFYGSQLRIIDARDATNPKVVGAINLEGDCGDSRIVGHVMYLVSHRWGYWSNATSTDNQDVTTVVSVDIADPRNIRVVDSRSFPRNGWDHHVFVNEQAIYLAASEWVSAGDSWGGTYRTTVQYIDITDPNGAIRLRGQTQAPGRVHDRWALDVYNQVLRVASGTAWGNGDVYLSTFDVSNPDAIAPLGQYTLHVNEQLKSARFDGNRGYLVSFRQIDPLFSFDLSNPAEPKLLGELEMTGWLDFMVPMGDRVVALGHDEVTDAQGNRNFSLAVSLVDVSTNQPTLLSRVVLDGAWGWVPSSNDDFAKVFRTLPEVNLIVFPFSAWDRTTYRHIGGVQLIDLFTDKLVKRGLIGNAGWGERGVVHGTDTVLTISSEVFQVMDIANRDSPRLRGRLELSRNVTEFALKGDYTVQLAGDWYQGDTRLVITSKSDPNTTSPVASVHVPAPYGRLFMNGDFAYVTGVVQTNGVSKTRIQVVDLTNPAAPVVRGSVELPEAVWGSYGWYYWGSGDEVVQVNGSALAFHRYSWGWYYEDCEGCGGSKPENQHKIYLVDLANPDEPNVASTVQLDNIHWAWGLRAQGNKLLLSDYESFRRSERWFTRYHLQQIDVSDLANPVVLSRISIPGWVVGTTPDGNGLFTLESWWDETSRNTRTTLHALELYQGLAYLQDSLALEGYLSNLQIEGGAGFATSYDYRSYSNSYDYRTELVSFDLSRLDDLRLAARVKVPTDWGWIRKVAGGRVFIGGNAGIYSYRVDELAAPEFETFFRTYGWVQDVLVEGDTAYLPSGADGVQIADLKQ